MAAPCLFLFLSERCNLSCEHCYVDASPAKSGMMSHSVFDQAIGTLVRAGGLRDVRLTGGEPTVHPEFANFVKALSNLECRVRLITNGVRLYRHAELAAQILEQLDFCWISVYGTTAERHAKTAGMGAIPLPRMESFVGANSLRGFRVGLSVLVSPGDLVNLDDCLNRLAETNVTHVRLIPIQPDGRASTECVVNWADWATEVQAIYKALLLDKHQRLFQSLQINDPFDLANRYVAADESCLLNSRRMWSLTPAGDLFTCCFNVYNRAHRIGSIFDVDIVSRCNTRSHGAVRCRGLSREFWGLDYTGPATCPISNVQISQPPRG